MTSSAINDSDKQALAMADELSQSAAEFFEILKSYWYFEILRMKRHLARNLPSSNQTYHRACGRGCGLGPRLDLGGSQSAREPPFDTEFST